MLGVVGHVAIDIIRKGSRSWKSPGGAPTYCSFYLRQMGFDVLPISMAGRDFSEYLTQYVERGIPTHRIKILNGCGTTSYEITYLSNDRRVLRLLSRCRDFMQEDLNDLPSVVAVNPIAREVSIEVLNYIRRQVRVLGVDLQGFTRVFDKDGYVSTAVKVDDLIKVLEIADLLKISVDDADVQVLNSIIERFPNKVVLITMGSRGSIMIYGNRRVQVVTGGIVDAKDPTGAGDVLTCLMTYLVGRGEDLVWSFVYSNAVAVAKTLGEGPYGSISRDLVESIVNKLYSRLTTA
ncbi:MAG: PfkB family carbohydrate kinase [Vulcanisaeta sp.]|nr:PfkB family carbohydrate kinase [Vulcanisaeta sp.]